ncbi:hypothetical protein CCHL11_05648 [Colletotrichum chlorophyti]|uniref:N-acetyltransferase domain-containing protein n=1 Tax=Colletotrichum chlorophyti TaxID=708187 RepID=A0A1Q8RTH7_9PEZI|nr:hypothetical protein CCHL11_05648 [Colletotrichum chlorophyti]
MSSTSAQDPPAVRAAKPDITLRAAGPTDVPALASIADAAFLADSHTQLKAQFHGPSSFADGMRDALSAWIVHPKVDVVVAEADSAPVGWIGWVRRGFPHDTDLPLSGPSQEPLVAGVTGRTIADLENLTNQSMEYWVLRFMPEGCRCRFICSFVVHPDFQSRGVGSRLLKWGTEKADREPGVYCWVQSSMGGQPAFERQGFREVGRLEANLDDFSEGKIPGEAYEHVTGSRTSWGNYAWVYMRREATA